MLEEFGPERVRDCPDLRLRFQVQQQAAYDRISPNQDMTFMDFSVIAMMLLSTKLLKLLHVWW